MQEKSLYSLRDHRGEELVLERHVGLRLQTDASAEDVSQAVALLGEGVDHRRARRCQGSLAFC
jgi:hypothetical protein